MTARPAWTLGRWIAAGALEQADIEDALYVAALSNGLVHDDGERQTWATIRSGLGAGLQQPKDLDADERRTPRRGRRKTTVADDERESEPHPPYVMGIRTAG